MLAGRSSRGPIQRLHVGIGVFDDVWKQVGQFVDDVAGFGQNAIVDTGQIIEPARLIGFNRILGPERTPSATSSGALAVLASDWPVVSPRCLACRFQSFSSSAKWIRAASVAGRSTSWLRRFPGRMKRPSLFWPTCLRPAFSSPRAPQRRTAPSLERTTERGLGCTYHKKPPCLVRTGQDPLALEA